MTAIQETQRLNFGSARLFGTDPSGNPLSYAQLQDVSADFKVDLKEAYSEGNYAFAVADGHRSIDISAKHYVRDMPTIANALGGSTPAANTTGYAIDEAHTIATHAVTAGNTNILQVFSVVVGVTNGGITVPTPFAIVASASEVQGVSCSYNATTGVFTFATGEPAGEPVLLTYSYTLGSSAGLTTAVSNTFQNSGTTFALVCLKRDKSRLDNSIGITAYTFYAVRQAGIKIDHKEGDYNVFDVSFKAYANPMGLVCKIDQVNV